MADMAAPLSIDNMTDENISVDSLTAGVDISTEVPLNAPNSSRNIAAHTALLSDDPEMVAQNYVAASQEMEEQGTSAIADDTASRQQASMHTERQQQAMELMADPSLTSEQRAHVAESAFGEQTPESLSMLVKEAALVQESEGATPYDEDVRDSHVNNLLTYEQVDAQLQAAINTELVHLYPEEDRGAAVAWDMFKLFIIPFTETSQGAKITDHFLGDSELLLGEAQAAIADAFRSMTPGQRLEAGHALIDLLNSEEGATWLGANDFGKAQFLREDLMRGEIDDVERYVNNVASVIEAVFFFNPIAKGAVRISSAMIKGVYNAISPAKSVAKVNPGKARTIHKAISDDETGEVAQALAGTDRTTALADDMTPPVMDGRPIPNDKVYKPNKEDDAVFNKGDTQYTDAEIAATKQEIENDFANIDPKFHMESSPVGLPTKTGSSSRTVTTKDGKTTVKTTGEQKGVQVDETGSGFQISAVYGRDQGGFKYPKDAMATVMAGLRKYGVLESDMKILKNTGEGYTPMTKSEILKADAGDYKVQLDFEYNMNPLNAGDGSILESSYNGFGGIMRGLAQANPVIPRYIFDPASMFKNTKFTGSASTAVEKSAALERDLLELGKEFSDRFTGLKKDRQMFVWEYIQRANKEGLSEGIEELRAAGLQTREIETVRQWRGFWDEAWRLENADMGKTLKARGFQVIEDMNKQTKLFARPIASPNLVKRNANIYDPATGKSVKMSAEEVAELYENGGTLGKLQRAEKIDGEGVEFVKVENTKNNYMRTIREDYDTVLDYRNGYYKVNYKDPIFIRKNLYDDAGELIGDRAIAVASNTKEAEEYLARLAADAGETDIDRFGRTTLDAKNDDVFSDHFDVGMASGRSSQRIRGERLDNASDPMNTSVSDRHIEGPVDAMIGSARSLANRVPTRDWLEGMKKRWMKQYADVAPKNNWDEATFPLEHKQIHTKGARASDVAQAKQAWEYIHYMENGYVAGMDKFIRGSLLSIADTAGKAGRSTLESAALGAAGKVKSVSVGKNLAFQAYLATNPLRQAIVQSHQMVQLAAVEPVYFATQMPFHASAMYSAEILVQLGKTKDLAKLAEKYKMVPDELVAMVKEYEASGLKASIDHQNLVEGSLNSMMDASKMRGRAGRIAGGVTSLPRRLGFDLGEDVNLRTAFLTFRNKAKKAGKDTSNPKVISEIAQEARNFTYNMNRAGDMPYNQNNWGMIMQFMQVPHKALLNMTFNKQLSGTDKARLAAFNFAMYGIPSHFILEQMDKAGVVPEDPAMRDVMTHGLEQKMVNWLITDMTGYESDLDLSNIAPLELHGWVEVFRTLASEGPIAALANSPGGKLAGGRMAPAMTDLMRTFGLVEDGQTPLESMELLKSFMSISSGYSNYMQYSLLQEYGKRYSQSGVELDSNMTPPEQIAVLFGIPTKGVAGKFELGREQYQAQQGVKDDIQAWYKDLKRIMYMKGEVVDKRSQVQVMQYGWAHFEKFGDVARSELRKLIDRDITNGDARMVRNQLELAGILTPEQNNRMIQDAPFTDDQKKFIKETYKLIAMKKDEK